MNLIIVGLNHRTAPVELREKLIFPTDAPDGTNVFSEPLKRLVTRYGINEAVILSTCNRVEVIGVAEDTTEGISMVSTKVVKISFPVYGIACNYG